MTLRPRTREQQHTLKKLLYQRRETPELHAMRELLVLRYEEAKHKLVDVAPHDLLKLQGEVKTYLDLLTMFDRSSLTDSTPAE